MNTADVPRSWHGRMQPTDLNFARQQHNVATSTTNTEAVSATSTKQTSVILYRHYCLFTARACAQNIIDAVQ